MILGPIAGTIKPIELTLRPSFAEALIPGVLWQFDNGLLDTLGSSANKLTDRGSYIFSLYPIHCFFVSLATSTAREDRGVLYETGEGWGQLEDVLEFSGLQQVSKFSIERANLEVEDHEPESFSEALTDDVLLNWPIQTCHIWKISVYGANHSECAIQLRHVESVRFWMRTSSLESHSHPTSLITRLWMIGRRKTRERLRSCSGSCDFP